ncbi:MAG: F0F1 ATP synthase subunit A [Candidatus Omnitrophica bacterium]|nr:F0F1 ATP synthase subunit A [Candidatus Omnitrophota bacterium]
MSDIGEIITKTIKLGGLELQINPHTIITTWIIIAFILFLAILIRRGLAKVPNRLQSFFEIVYNFFAQMCHEALGDDGRKFIPLILTIFIFVLVANWSGVIPGQHGPTEDLNSCLGLGILVFIIAHFSAIMNKGIKGYLRAYFKPFFFFMPINVIGEFGKVISHSFRLFGNMFAGGVIFALGVPVLFKTFESLNLPVLSAVPLAVITYLILQTFFGLFVGFVQALVFSLLALTYIAVLRGE